MQTTSAPNVTAPVRAHFEALNRKDIDGLMRLFTNDSVVMVSEAETATGTDQMRAAYEYCFTIFEFGRELHVDESLVRDNVAVVRCRSTGSLKLPASGQTLQAVAREIFVLQLGDDGWKVRSYMNNLPKPLA